MPKIDEPLKLAIAEKASDIHLSSGEPIRLRIDGDLEAVGQKPLSAAEVQGLIHEILTDEEKEKFLRNKNLDKSINIAEGHFRVNLFFTRRGPAAVLRAIPKKIPTMADLNLPESIGRLTNLPKGLVLVTGPTGSGKSTTLAAMLHHINLNYKYHILTVEDPVEFVHESRGSLINQREIGTHCHTFADALKYALREDPDVILVGEMRDLETIGLALTAAETGHLVFGTLHTRGAAASVDRIIDSFPANQQAMIRTMLSESLAAVISQCLIKRSEGRGRAAAYEILIVNTAISNLIREGKTFQMPSIIQTSRKEGMVLMEQSILELVQKKVVRPEDAAAYLEDPGILGNIKTGQTSPSISILTKSNPSIKSVSMKPPAPPPSSKPNTQPVPSDSASQSPMPKLQPSPPKSQPSTEQTATAGELSATLDSVDCLAILETANDEKPESFADLSLGEVPMSSSDVSDPGLELTDSPLETPAVSSLTGEMAEELASELEMASAPDLETPPPSAAKPVPALKAVATPAKAIPPAANKPPPPKPNPSVRAAPPPVTAAKAPPAPPGAPKAMPTRPGPPPPPAKKAGNG